MKNLALTFIFLYCHHVGAFGGMSAQTAARTAVALKDHSASAIALFNNMRTPAALIGGSLVPLGIMSAPRIEANDSKTMKVVKKMNVVLGVVSLLSEIMAVVYSSIAINKLSELDSPVSFGCAELIAQRYELEWIGTNIHFFFGLMGYLLIVGSKAYIAFGNPLGTISAGWAVAAFLQAVSVVNKGIAMGYGTMEDYSSRFATNIFTLILRYFRVVFLSARGGFFSASALAMAFLSFFQTIRVLLHERVVLVPEHRKDN